MLPLLVIGNPENRRVTGFVAEARASGVAVQVLEWLRLIEEPGCLLERPERELGVRIDSWGENVAVERALLRRGLPYVDQWPGASRLDLDQIDAATAQRGRVAAPRQAHQGLRSLLGQLTGLLAQRPGWRCLQPISAIAKLFDKRACHVLAAHLGLRQPELLPDAASPEQLLASLRERGVTRAYVKLTCGSSASCLALVELGVHGPSVVTSLELSDGCFYNSLKVRRYAGAQQIERVLGFLLGEGAIVEGAIDKLPSAGRHADVRLLAVRGVAPFAVLRTSVVPITNLHLGGQRGDLEQYRLKLPEGAWQEAVGLVERLASALGTWHLGADVAFERASGRPYLLEGNAFGDLLPGLQRDGRSIYGWEIESLASHS